MMTPCSSNASGTASATTSIAAITTNIASRTRPSSGLSVFVSHAYAAHAHQSAASTTRPRTSPPQVGSFESRLVTWVIANTKTRSKKSSSGVTRSTCSDADASTARTLAAQGSTGSSPKGGCSLRPPQAGLVASYGHGRPFRARRHPRQADPLRRLHAARAGGTRAHGRRGDVRGGPARPSPGAERQRLLRHPRRAGGDLRRRGAAVDAGAG